MAIFRISAYPSMGGMDMQAQDYWKIFLETGAPEVYLMYNQARRMEETDVSDHQRSGVARVGLQ